MPGKNSRQVISHRRILTCTAEFQNGTPQGLNLQKSKGLTSIQQLVPFLLQSAKQSLLSVTHAADNPKTSSLPHEAKALAQLKSSPLSALLPPHPPSILPQTTLLRPSTDKPPLALNNLGLGMMPWAHLPPHWQTSHTWLW